MVRLFEDFKRTHTGTAEFRMSDYEFMNESAWDSCEYARRVVEKWYQEYPRNAHFHNRFTDAQDDLQHQGAFFELYCHQYLTRHGWNLEVADLSDTIKLPDFKIKSAGMFVECALGKDPYANPTDRIKDMIRHRIEQIPSSEYALLVHFEKDSHITPSLRRIQGMLQDLIQSDRNTTEFVDGNWHIRFEKVPHLFGRTYGGGSDLQKSGWEGNPIDALKRSLQRKRRSEYDEFDGSYVIAINTLDITLLNDEVKSVLFGAQKHPGLVPFFSSDHNRSISGIFLAKNCMWANMGCVQIQFWPNPWASFPVDQDAFKCPQIVPVLDRRGLIADLEHRPGMAAYEVLGIKEHYLGSHTP